MWKTMRPMPRNQTVVHTMLRFAWSVGWNTAWPRCAIYAHWLSNNAVLITNTPIWKRAYGDIGWHRKMQNEIEHSTEAAAQTIIIKREQTKHWHTIMMQPASYHNVYSCFANDIIWTFVVFYFQLQSTRMLGPATAAKQLAVFINC